MPPPPVPLQSCGEWDVLWQPPQSQNLRSRLALRSGGPASTSCAISPTVPHGLGPNRTSTVGVRSVFLDELTLQWLGWNHSCIWDLMGGHQTARPCIQIHILLYMDSAARP